jgi:folylpolyglutamate synthase/dihydropteroate synthase
MNTDELANIARELVGETAIEITADIRSALTLARRIVIGEGPICVTGSLYLVGEARATLLAD